MNTTETKLRAFERNRFTLKEAHAIATDGTNEREAAFPLEWKETLPELCIVSDEFEKICAFRDKL